MRQACFLLVCILFVSLAFADVGPPPSHATVLVYMQKNGAPYTSMDSITYHCDGSNSTDNGSVTQKLINLSCTAGVCDNSNWFYKFNPCYLSSGFFSYEYEGRMMETGTVDLTDTGTHSITVDVETGNMQDQHNPPGPGCLPAFLLPVLAFSVIATRK